VKNWERCSVNNEVCGFFSPMTGVKVCCHVCYTAVTSANKVMFSLCLLVCLLAGLRKNYSSDFHKIRWKNGTWAAEEPIGFCGNPDHVTLGSDRVTIDVLRHTRQVK